MTADITTLANPGEFRSGNEMFEKIIKINDELLGKLEKHLVETNELGLFQVDCSDFTREFVEEQKKNIGRLQKFVEKNLEVKERECRQFL
jgi:hypothetical protein